jgi:hypothetical protein
MVYSCSSFLQYFNPDPAESLEPISTEDGVAFLLVVDA